MVRLPLREQPVEAARGTLLTDAAWQHSRRVLLVDDNQDGVELLAEAPALQGHQVHVAFEAEQGLLLAEQHRPQLALLDIGLPGMDGHALAARMRTLLGDDCTLVALSGYSQQGDRERARGAGFAHYLVKPVDPAPAGVDGRLWRRRRAGAAAIAGRQCDGAVELRVKWAAGACAASTSSYEKNTNDARPPQQKSGGRGAGQAGTPRNGLGPAAGVVPWGKTPQAAQGGQSFSSRRSAARSTGLRK